MKQYLPLLIALVNSDTGKFNNNKKRDSRCRLKPLWYLKSSKEYD